MKLHTTRKAHDTFYLSNDCSKSDHHRK